MNKRLLALFGSPFLFSIFSLWGQTITLTSDDIEAAGGLRAAMDSINSAPGATNTINIPFSSLTGQSFNLPPISIGSGNSLTITSTVGGTTYDGGSSFRGFFVNTGGLTVEEMTIQNVVAQGGSGGRGNAAGGGGLGAGGAFFVADTLTINTTTIGTSKAIGGAGGAGAIVSGVGSGGGGGGMGGSGGNSGTGSGFGVGGGGGGGLFGNGGNGGNSNGAAGGGGGGLFGNGGSGSSSPSQSGGGGGGGGSNLPSNGGNGGTPSDSTAGTAGTVGGGAGGTGNVAQPASNGTNGSNYGGGGGGGAIILLVGNNSNGGNGGLFGGGGAGGMGYKGNGTSGTGGFGGGGAGATSWFANTTGSATSGPGGAGGFGGGGGGSTNLLPLRAANGANGGFGGGGSGAVNGGTGGASAQGNFGGAGGSNGPAGSACGGGGGAGLGGAFFIASTGNVTIQDGFSLTGTRTVASGLGGSGASGGGTGGAGQALGLDFFLMSGGQLTFSQSDSVTVSTAIVSDNGAGGGSGGGITKNGTGTLTLSGANTYTGTTTLSSGLLVLGNSSALSSTPLLMSTGTVLGLNNGISVSNGITLPTSGTGSVAVSTGNTATLSGVIGGTTSTLSTIGNGTLVLTGTNTYTGTTGVNAGTLSVSADANLGNAAAILSFDGGTLQTTTSFSSARTVTLVGDGTFDVEPNSSTTLTLTNVISGSNGALTKTGPGTLVLSGTNTYARKTELDAGTLSVSADANLGNSSAFLSFDGGTLQTTASFSSARAVTLAGAGIIDVESLSSNTLTLSNAITGAGFLIKTGPGTLALSGTNTYSGGTTVSEGTLFGDATSLQGNIDNNAIVDFDQTGTGTYSGIMAGTGALFKTNTGTLVLNTANTYSAGTILFAGEILLANDSGLGTGTLVMNDGTTLGLNNSISFSNHLALADSGTSTVDVPSGTAILSGTITGVNDTLAKTSGGNLVLSGNNTYTGTTALSDGSITLGSNTALGTSALTMSNGTILSVDGGINASNAISITPSGLVGIDVSSGTGTLSGIISGTSSNLVKLGSGNLSLTGNDTYSGITSVANGRLSVNGQLSSPVTVESGAILGGIGQILAAVTIQDGATLRPGNSVGTLQVASLTLNSASLTQIEVSAPQSSQIQVTGTANLAGTLEVIFDPGEYTAPHDYTILTAGTVNGTFSNVLDIPTDFKIGLQYTSTSVILQLLAIQLGLPVSQLSGNAASFASYLNSLPSSYLDANTELSDILIFDLSALSGSALQQALISLTPSRNSDANFALQNTLFAASSVISNRLSSQRIYLSSHAPKTAVAFESSRPFTQEELTADAEERLVIKTKAPREHYAIWADGFGEFSRQKAQNQNTAFHADASGVFLGFDFLGERSLIGLAAGYAPTSIKEAQRAGSGTVDSYLGMLYGTGYFGQFYLEMAVLGAYNHYTNKRNIVIPPTFTATARSEHNGGSITPHLGFGYDFNFDWATIEPYAAFDYTTNFEKGYQERGAAPLNMSVKRRTSSMLRSEAGLNFYQEAKFENGAAFIAREQFSWVNKKPFHIGKTTSTFVGAPGFFTTTVLNSTQNLFSPALQLFYKKANGFFLSATYEGEFGNGYDSNTILGKLGYAF